MGIDGRPERGSKVKALHKLTNHDDDEPALHSDEHSYDATPRATRNNARRHIDSDDSPQSAVANAVYEASRAVNASSRRDDHPFDPDIDLSEPDDHDDDLDSYQPSHNGLPAQRSVKLRLKISDNPRASTQTRSGRVSRPPPPDPLHMAPPPPTRRRSSADMTRPPADLTPRPERYPLRTRNRASYDEEADDGALSEEILDEQIRPSRSRKRSSRDACLDHDPSPRRRTRNGRNNITNDDDDDDDDDDHHEQLADDDDEDAEDDEDADGRHYVSIPKNGARKRTRLNKLVDLDPDPSPRESRRQTRSSRRSAAPSTAYDQSQYLTRRAKSGVKKEPDLQNGSVRKDDPDGEDGDGDADGDAARDSDGDFKVPSDPESDDAEHEEPLESQDLLPNTGEQDEEEDDEENDPDHDENPRRRSQRLRPRKRKEKPRRSVRKSRKRLRDVDAHQEENSMAKRVRESYRPRNESVRRSDFYNRDGESESSDSSGDVLVEGRRRSTREAATRASDRIATANDLAKLDFLQNPMGLPDAARAPRPKRRSGHRGRLRPSRPDPFASDDDDVSANAGAAPIEPILVDLNLSWDDIGGLDHHVRALKEMVFLPLMYPEVFEKFKMEAPKGVLFYGPPGTGKTLCARALAASCGADPDPEPAKPEGSSSDAAPSAAASNPTQKTYPHAGVERPKEGTGASAVQSAAHLNANLAAEAENAVEELLNPIESANANKAPDGSKDLAAESSNGKSKDASPSNPAPGNGAESVQAPPTDQKPPVKKKPRVAFFMRNGADCLSKWVGEAERQLRMTFEAAKRHQPAIIFFDEIDGLAPVRSSRQDQIHASIVSTLLGLMDGLDARGKIVVIGATNRVDAIDPALRRPGRFDRELIFTLPNAEARKKILQIHTKEWKPPLKKNVIEAVGKLTVGYCGADLKALCSEAAIRALRRRYPQIYNSNDKLLINIDEVRVCAKDFVSAMKDVVPASHRSAITHARPIPDRLAAVLNGPLTECLASLQRIFPQGLAEGVDLGLNLTKRANVAEKSKPSIELLDSSDDDDDEDLDIQLMQSKMAHAGKLRANAKSSSHSHSLRPRLLVCGAAGLGQNQLGPAILHHCEGCPVHPIDYPTLHAESGARTPQEALISAFREASKSLPSILYLPHLDLWWKSADESLRTMLSILLDNIPADSPLLVLATAAVSVNQLPQELMNFFAEIQELVVPTEDARKAMFAPLVTAAQKVPAVSDRMAQQKRKRRAEEVLPKAPPPPPQKLSKDDEMRKLQSEARFIRILRMEMRSFVESLLRDRRFKAFWTPVDPTSAPDYYEIIKNPMDIQKIAANVDAGRYPTVVAMVNDFDVMVRNAIQYNPPNTEVGALILRRAHGLIDIVHAWVDNLNPGLVETCNKIISERVERAKAEEASRAAEAEPNGKSEGEDGKEKTGEKQGASRVDGAEEPESKNHATLGGQKDEKMSDEPIDVDKQSPEQDLSKRPSRRLDVMDVDALVNPPVDNMDRRAVVADTPVAETMVVDGDDDVVVVEACRSNVEYLTKEFQAVSSGMTVDGLEGLYVQCEKVVVENRRNPDRAETVRAVLSSVARARDDPALVSNLVE